MEPKPPRDVVRVVDVEPDRVGALVRVGAAPTRVGLEEREEVGQKPREERVLVSPLP